MRNSQLSLFRDITDSEIQQMIQCYHMRSAAFAPGETICVYGRGSGDVGVITQGAANVVRFDYAGNRTILERLEEDGVFGEALVAPAAQGDSLEVVCSEACQVLFLSYAHIVGRCEKACQHHSKLVHNMFRLVAEQTRRLNQRLEVLTCRTIRDKLLCYFHICCREAGRDTFQLPFTLSALADYISTDRSAMMRELKKMRLEGLISMEGRQVTLTAPEGR